jgi:hypothetical protein
MDGPVWTAMAQRDIQSPPAPLLLALLAAFHSRAISYCYWKSSKGAHTALSGESDLDLLIARGDQHRAQGVLLERGFKCFPSDAHRDHPEISSFLGYDESSGRILHVHLHFRLVVGEKLLKNYRLLWEDTILARAVVHENLPIRVLDPASEALLLVVRYYLEMRHTDPIALRHWRAITLKFETDRAELAARLDRLTFRNRAGEVFDNDLAESVTEAVFGERPLKSQGRLRRRIRKQMAALRAYNTVEAALRSCGRAVLWAAGELNHHFLHVPRPWRRRAPGGGCIVAVLGVDGSGKTTVVAAIGAWLAPEVDVLPIYFGTGEGRPSLLLLPFKLLVPLVSTFFAVKPKGATHGKISGHAPAILYSCLLILWAVVVAAEKRIKLVAARRGADRGLVVVADRYPQNEDAGYNDGPLLPRLKRAPRCLRNLETSAYTLARRLPPDLVIKLEVTPGTAARREPNMDPMVIRERIEAARRLTFPGARVVRVDAERPLADVLRLVKREIWHTL